MTGAIIFKALVIILIIMIFLSLSGGLFFLTKDRGKTKRVMYSLTARVILSVSLFILLFIGFWTGLIQPHGLFPTENTTSAGPAP